MTSCAVYRHYDRLGALLYIGMSSKPDGRFAQHRSKSAWWSEVARTSLDWFPSRSEAASAEASAILSERPIHSVMCQPTDAPEDTGEGDLWALVLEFCRAKGMAVSRFGMEAIGDPNIARQIASGRELRRRTANRVLAYIATGKRHEPKRGAA